MKNLFKQCDTSTPTSTPNFSLLTPNYKKHISNEMCFLLQVEHKAGTDAAAKLGIAATDDAKVDDVVSFSSTRAFPRTEPPGRRVRTAECEHF